MGKEQDLLLKPEETRQIRKAVALPEKSASAEIDMVCFADEVGEAVAKAQLEKVLKHRPDINVGIR